jgi:hypothetical protein
VCQFPSHPRAPPGYRPPFPKVRAWCITLMLAARGADEGSRTLIPSLEGWNSAIELHPHGAAGGDRIPDLMLFRHPLSRLSYSGMVGKQGIEPRLPAPRAGALTITLHPGGGPPRIRTEKPSPCEGVALPLELAARRGACGIRTRDLLLAEQARYLAAPRPHGCPRPCRPHLNTGADGGSTTTSEPGPGSHTSVPGGPPCAARC